jgi:hypothetical protein
MKPTQTDRPGGWAEGTGLSAPRSAAAAPEKENRHAYHKPPKPSKWEYGLPTLACASLLLACGLVSARKLYWNDELFSYYFVSDPSFASMLASFHDKLNNTPLLYFALGWVWDKAFGSAELSLRLFSSLGICLALLLTWATLRRTYGFWATSLGTLAVFGTSTVILDQNAEARMYGLFLALGAGAFLLYERLCRRREPGGGLLWVNAAVHVGLVHTHLFGGFYSGAVLVSLFLTDRYLGRWRPRVYLSVIGSWLTILFYLPSFLVQAEAGRPRTWIPVPELADLVDVMNITASPFFRRPIFLLLLALLALFLFRRWSTRSGLPRRSPGLASPADVPQLVFAAAFLVLPAFIWLFSLTLKPIFYDRYLMPTALGWTILLTAFFYRILPTAGLGLKYHTKWRSLGGLTTALGALFILGGLAVFLINPIWIANRFPVKGLIEDVVDLKGHADLPIVMQTGGAFFENLHYASEPDKYYFVQDWEVAVNAHSGLFSPQEYKHMEAWKRRYPQLFKNVVTTDEFLKEHDRFLVLDLPDFNRKCPLKPVGLRRNKGWEDLYCPQWVEIRLLNNSAYKLTYLGNEDWFSVLLVEKQPVTEQNETPAFSADAN